MLELILLMLAVLVALNAWVTWRVLRDTLSSPTQRAAHAVIVWLLPFAGALVVLQFQRKQPERGLGQYPNNPDPGDDFGISPRSFRLADETVESTPSSSHNGASHD